MNIQLQPNNNFYTQTKYNPNLYIKNNRKPIINNTPSFTGIMDKPTKFIENKYFINLFGSDFTEYLVKHDTLTNNIVDFLQVTGSAIISGMYVYKTLNNEKLDDDRKRILAVNQTLTWLVSTIGGLTISKLIDKQWDKFTDRYIENRAGSPVLNDIKNMFKNTEKDIIISHGQKFAKDIKQYVCVKDIITKFGVDLKNNTKEAQQNALAALSKILGKDNKEYIKLSEEIEKSANLYLKKEKFDLPAMLTKTGEILASDPNEFSKKLKSELRKADFENQSKFVMSEKSDGLKSFLESTISDDIKLYKTKYVKGEYAESFVGNSMYYDDFKSYAQKNFADKLKETSFDEIASKNEHKDLLKEMYNKYIYSKETAEIEKMAKNDFTNNFINKVINETHGMKVLKSLLVFGTIYRFISPVAVTPLANWIGSKLFSKEK